MSKSKSKIENYIPGGDYQYTAAVPGTCCPVSENLQCMQKRVCGRGVSWAVTDGVVQNEMRYKYTNDSKICSTYEVVYEVYHMYVVLAVRM